MLKEWKQVRQVSGEGFRRWFNDEELELVVWYPSRGTASNGFQLCIGAEGLQRSLIWKPPSQFIVERIDAGEARSGHHKSAPISVADDGDLDAAELARRFAAQAEHLDPEVRELVIGQLTALAQGTAVAPPRPGGPWARFSRWLRTLLR